ncbi:MAG: D-alanine--D-alanine ligase [Oligoflexia bacterium]|nr:D-alanine--D-alanine ligase [Oligoflexia bacterium]
MEKTTGRKLKVAVLYGGRSGEHEVSLRSAASVIRNLDPSRYEVIPVGIDKDGRWLLNDVSLIEKGAQALPIFKNHPVVLPPNPSTTGAALIPLGSAGHPSKVDVVFPVMHGPLCEDGTVQGLLELADVPYVGCGVLASAVGMDKEVSKRLVRDAGLPIVPYVSARSEAWRRDRAAVAARVAQELGYPVFVKPANLGSSVGVHKVKTAAGLEAALEDAFRYDTKVLIERSVEAREIELAVLESPEPGAPPLVSVPGEVVPAHEFYSYEAKYLDENGAALNIPARLTPEQVREAQRIAGLAFSSLECEGMTRVDLFIDKKDGRFYFNEVNTIPGFTSISMYPKMWEASGIGYQELLSRLIDLALARHGRRRELVREFHKS